MSHRGDGGAVPRDAVRVPGGGRARVLPPLPPLSVRPDAQLRRDMAAYAEHHDLRGIMDQLAQSVLLRMPQDPRSFLAAELAQHRAPGPTDSRDAGALPRDGSVFVLRLHAAVESGVSSTKVNVRRVLSRLPRGNMARAQVERDIAEQVHALLWDSGDAAEHRGAEAAEGAGHHQQRIKELEELLAELKHQAQQDQASASPPEKAAKTVIPHGLMLALSVLDDAALSREFDAHADLAAGTDNESGERRMSKDGLAQFMRSKGLAHGDAEIERVMSRMDTNGDGGIDSGEFRALARANSDLEQALRTKHPECVLAAFFRSGTALEDLGKMDHAQFSAVVDESRNTLVALLVELGAQLAAVGTAQHAAEGGKFASELKGGTLQDFYQGVTGLCGEPDTDLEAGMRREHTECTDSDVAFSTSNYGITTTPRTEFELVASGGSGCAKAEGVEEGVVVTGTRGCCKASGRKWAKMCSDPTAPHFTRGLQWEDVGAEPKEGRRLASAKLQDALANKMAMFVVKQGCRVRATATFENIFHPSFFQRETKEVPKGTLGIVTKIDEDGDYDDAHVRFQKYKEPGSIFAKIDFEGIGAQWVSKSRFNEVLVVTQIHFTQEELDAFDFTDLRSTDIVEAGGRYFHPAASSAQILENVRLAEALKRQTEFTQPEWDAFRIRSLRMSHLVKAGGCYYRPARTEEEKDVRVVRPLAYYGNFGVDGRLKWGVGNKVAVSEEFAAEPDGRIRIGNVVQEAYNPVYVADDASKQGVVEEERRERLHGAMFSHKVRWEDGTLSDWLGASAFALVPLLQKEVKGTVLEFNTEGAAKIDFGKRLGVRRVPKDQFYCLYPLPSERDTPIQRRVKLGKLRRCDVTALVMYTGECLCVVRELACSGACILQASPLFQA